MKSFKEFSEGILDDLVGEFGDFKETKKPKTIKSNYKPKKAYKPRVTIGVADVPRGDWIRSERELKKLLNGKITLDGIVKLFAKENLKVSDSFIVNLDVKEINKVREYDRDLDSGFTGKSSESEMIELENSIKQYGIKDYAVITMKRYKNGNVGVLLGEVNHRLNIAKKLKLKTMPIKFYINS